MRQSRSSKATDGVKTQIVEQIDLFPALADLCGLGAVTGIAGRNFAGLVRGKRYAAREFADAEYWFRNVFTKDDRCEWCERTVGN